jgi:hypothetical protein
MEPQNLHIMTISILRKLARKNQILLICCRATLYPSLTGAVAGPSRLHMFGAVPACCYPTVPSPITFSNPNSNCNCNMCKYFTGI